MCLKTYFKIVSAQLVKVSDRMPYEIWDYIEAAFTTVTLNKFSKAIGNFHKLERTTQGRDYSEQPKKTFMVRRYQI